jgi:hypothetical protein
MKSSYELKKEELALEVLKIHRDANFGRIDPQSQDRLIKPIMAKAKLHNIGPNEILQDVWTNQKVYEKVLEQKYKLPYSTDKKENPDHIV